MGATVNQEPCSPRGGALGQEHCSISPGLHIKSLVCTPRARGRLSAPTPSPSGRWCTPRARGRLEHQEFEVTIGEHDEVAD
jgi:hypothetical protein